MSGPLRFLYTVECGCECELNRHVEIVAGDPDRVEVGDEEEIDCPNCDCPSGEVIQTHWL